MTWGRPLPSILLVALPALLAGAAAGCYRALPVREDPGERPRALADAEKAYLRNDTGKALQIYERFRKENPGSPHEALAFYFEGQCLLLEGSPILARQRLEAALPSADETLRGRVHLALGNSYFVEDRYDEAEQAYLAARASPGIPADEALFKAALCARRLGDWAEAERRLREIVEKHPTGPRAETARQHLDWTDRHFAIQAGMFKMKKNADSRAAEMRKTGLEPRVQTVGASGERLYRVSVGRFSDYAEAKRQMDALRAKGVLTDALIIP